MLLPHATLFTRLPLVAPKFFLTDTTAAPRTPLPVPDALHNMVPPSSRSLLCVCAALCLFTAILTPTTATILAASSIEYCLNDGTLPFTCTKKMVVALAVDADTLPGTEEIYFVNTAEDKTAAGSPQVRFVPVRVTTSRSQVRHRYPLEYVRDFNAKPFEHNIEGTLADACVALPPGNPHATCGVKHDVHGNAIEFSEGFCCTCTACQLVGPCDNPVRTSECSLFGVDNSASCLRFGTLWYSGFFIGEPTSYFTLNVSLSITNATESDSAAPQSNRDAAAASTVTEQSAVLTLSPDNIGASASSPFGVMARLVGDFDEPTEPLVLSTHMLFLPSTPLDDARVLAGAVEWMLVERYHVTLDGQECNKIGVSYAAFAKQGSRCSVPRGTCLGSQLEHYRSQDMADAAAGKKTHFLLSSFGDAEFEYGKPNSTSSHPHPFLSFLATTPTATLVTIVMNADNITYVNTVANGTIEHAVVPNQPVTSVSSDAVIDVLVRNTGDIVATFTLSALCDAMVLPIAAKRFSMLSNATSAHLLPLKVQDPSAKTSHARCLVILQNSQEVEVDRVEVIFAVQPADSSNGNQDSSDSSSSEKNRVCAACHWVDPLCFFKKRCFGQLAIQLAVVIAIFLIALVAYFHAELRTCLAPIVRRRRPVHKDSGSINLSEPTAPASAMTSQTTAVLMPCTHLSSYTEPYPAR